MNKPLLADLKSRRFRKSFCGHLLATLGAESVVIQIWLWIFPTVKFLSGIPLFVAVTAIALGYAIFQAWPRPIEEEYSQPNTRIKIVKGDIFEESEHLVIGTCDTFDTEPPHIIARGSVQGQTLDRLFNSDRNKLDQELDAALAGSTPIETVAKSGKTDRYELGTVAKVPYGTRTLFFLAYTEMDTQNNAHGSPDGIWKSLNSLWSEVRNHANGRSVSIPVIGGGMSRLSQVLPAQDSIRFMALSFMLASRQVRVCDELRIIVRAEDYEKLDRLELQAFLTSLKPS